MADQVPLCQVVLKYKQTYELSELNYVFTGSQGRPDSRGPPALIEVHEPPSHTNQVPLLKASLGPVLSNGNSVAPRIRQLQMQLGVQASTTNGHQPSPTCAPRGSLV